MSGFPNGQPGWACNPTFGDYWWDAFNFNDDYWDDGFGIENGCDTSRPLARTLNAMYALGYSTTATPTCSTSSGNVTLWAMCWSADKIKQTRAGCGSGTVSGTPGKTVRGVTNYTIYYSPFFFGMTVSQRAAVIFHEARHADGCGHNGESCDGGSSCDESWEDGCPALGNQTGANKYLVLYAQWYANTAVKTTSALKTDVVLYANHVLQNYYDSTPQFLIGSNGVAYDI